MVPADDIESIKRRNEERQRRLQAELAKLKPTEIPPPPSAFSNAIDAALSSTPLDELTPDFGIPVEGTAPGITPTPTTPEFPDFEIPAPPPEFTFRDLEEHAPVAPPEMPPEFAMPSEPIIPAAASVPEMPVEATTTRAQDDDFFSDLPSAWGTTIETPEVTIPPVTIETPVVTSVPPVFEAPEILPEPIFSIPEVETAQPLPTEAEITERPEFVLPESYEPFIAPEPVAEPEISVASIIEKPIIIEVTPTVEPEITTKVEIPHVIVAFDNGRLRWGRVGIESEEEAVSLLEKAIEAYYSMHPKH